MTLIARVFSGIGAATLSLGLILGPAFAGDEANRCDCGCPGYAALIDAIDSRPALAAALIDQCGRNCAIAWVRCESEDGPGATQTALKELLDRFLDGASSGDVAMHDRFWSDDLVYTSSAGQRYGKSELMSGLSSSSGDAEPTPVYAAEQLRIRIYDQLALIDFTLVATTTDDSQQRFLNSGVLKLENDQWRAINWQATRKAEP